MLCKTHEVSKQEKINELKFLQLYETPIVPLANGDNYIFVKKEECIPFSFGGNKVRIASRYFTELVEEDADCVVTYGASTSNLCRVIANMAYRYGISCYIISPEEGYHKSANSMLVEALGARILTTPLDCVHQTIEEALQKLRKEGRRPYFIYGGGYGKLGTDSYRVVLSQIVKWEKENNITLDHIFITVGTGTSISGLILENKYSGANKHIVGISVAREIDRATDVLKDAINNYGDNGIGLKYELYDYRLGGYGKYNDEVIKNVFQVFKLQGLNLDTTYTGKAFTGMMKYIKEAGIKGERILFIHTGGTPLFFDTLISKWGITSYQ